MAKVGQMYYSHDKEAKEWYITKLYEDGNIRVEQETYKTKKEAEKYIRMMGFKPIRWEDENV